MDVGRVRRAGRTVSVLRLVVSGGSVLLLAWLAEDDRADVYGPWIVAALAVVIVIAVAWLLRLRRR